MYYFYNPTLDSSIAVSDPAGYDLTGYIVITQAEYVALEKIDQIEIDLAVPLNQLIVAQLNNAAINFAENRYIGLTGGIFNTEVEAETILPALRLTGIILAMSGNTLDAATDLMLRVNNSTVETYSIAAGDSSTQFWTPGGAFYDTASLDAVNYMYDTNASTVGQIDIKSIVLLYYPI